MSYPDRHLLSYIIGVAIGDDNLSNPNGRAVRLRITCDLKYPNLIKKMMSATQKLLPKNKVSFAKASESYGNISCYSNKWEDWLGWKAKNGPKSVQNIKIPDWIKQDKEYVKLCLKGLLETDGSIYKDRGYLMVNFVTVIPTIADDVIDMINLIGYKAYCYKIFQKNKFDLYNIRISKQVKDFIKEINLEKN